MSNRTEWEFPYSADKLLHAAQGKHDHHYSRLEWWDGKKGEIIAQVRAEGIEIDESVADIASSVSNSYQRQPTVQIRTDLVRDLQECVQKVQEHRGKMKEYDAWIQVLQSQGAASFALYHDDWLFFFGRT